MYKYYDILDNKKNISLYSYVDENKKIHNTNFNVEKISIYKNLLSQFNELYKMFIIINENYLYSLYSNNKIGYEEYVNVVSLYEKIKYDYDIPEIVTSNNDLMKINIITSLLTELFNIGKIDSISNFKTLYYKEYKKHVLPDSWYINPYGKLYNTMGKEGHKEANLIYDFDRIREYIKKDIPLEEIKNKLYNQMVEINKRNYVNKYEVSNTIKHIDMFSYDNKYYNELLVTLVKGVYTSKYLFYEFFNNIQKYTNKPNEELNKLKSMTNNDIRDILVRCCSFSKIESSLNKVITTSNINYENDLSNYIYNNWNISFLNPIIVKRDIKTIEELNVNSYFVRKYLRKD